MQVCSFPPIARKDAKVLILGSMPGVASLAANQYYAHPRNAFWGIMDALFEAGPDLAYTNRVARLMTQRIAVWDVLKTCVRGGSLDSSIVEETIVPNDFAEFFAVHRKIEKVCFNGTKAENAFRRYVLPGLTGIKARVEFVRLPSTSPAHAGQSFEKKLAAWRKGLNRQD